MASTAHGLPMFGGARPDARTILRLNGIASLALGALTLVLAGPLARLSGVGRPGLLALIGAFLVGYGTEELGFATGRGLRRTHVVLFALTDIAWIAAVAIFLVAGPEALSFLERALIAIVALTFGWFALAGFRAARAL